MNGLGELLVSLGVIFLASLAFDYIGRRTFLPRVTLLIGFGFLIGPAMLDILPSTTNSWFPAITTMTLLMVGFLLGGRLTAKELRKRGAQVMMVSIAVAMMTFGIVAAGLLLFGLPFPVAMMLAAIATATDPAATADVVADNKSESPFSSLLLDIVAVDDAWGLILFSIALALSRLSFGTDVAEGLMHGAWDLGGALALGIVLGIPLAALTGRIRPGAPSLAEALGSVLLCGGLALLLNVSFLLAAMTMGMVVANRARHHKRPFHAIENVESPFMLVFFVLAGASLDVSALAASSLWLAAYVVLRIAGRILGGWLGGSLQPRDASVRRWMGLSLLPQAGIALGMALVATQHFEDVGAAIMPVVVAGTVLFELGGPIATRFALHRVSASAASGSGPSMRDREPPEGRLGD